ncbi:hypothetical protein TrLO_g9554 [Triparma laevis f. longispina]|uniref:Uncharacterized protein n=1 Tax=Triparma laevis f. longispina TaxID=1714387 RepID=A0A9W6ZHJ2_9STRA|nr:hypothetical protein TrLO_g9554 [Triparma laevis f. longispina]
MWPFGSSEPSPLNDQIISGTFPNVLKGCENQSTALFKCLDDLTLEDEKTSVSSCSELIKKYNDCSYSRKDEKRNEKFKRIQERVPEEYRYVASK